MILEDLNTGIGTRFPRRGAAAAMEATIQYLESDNRGGRKCITARLCLGIVESRWATDRSGQRRGCDTDVGCRQRLAQPLKGLDFEHTLNCRILSVRYLIHRGRC